MGPISITERTQNTSCSIILIPAHTFQKGLNNFWKLPVPPMMLHHPLPFSVFALVGFCPFFNYQCFVRECCVLSACWQPVLNLLRPSFVTPFVDYPSPPYIYIAYLEQCLGWNCRKSCFLCILTSPHLLKVICKWEVGDERGLVLSEDQVTVRLLVKRPGKALVYIPVYVYVQEGFALVCPCWLTLPNGK